jgi:predicted RNase H-like nuclease
MIESDWAFVGIDGCRAGWIAVTLRSGRSPTVGVHTHFAEVLSASGETAVLAVDMPIGLPDFVGKGGRGPERVVRRFLGERQSSVFSIPSRAAVSASNYAEACQLALLTSDPPRKVSKQAFFLFPKILQIDGLMSPGLQARVREVHPEVAFWQLNDEQPMSLPKKVGGRSNPSGIQQRRALLMRCGFTPDFLEQRPPIGAAVDDFIDACVCALVSQRIALGTARSFPELPQCDERGLHMAIWA